MIIALLIKPDSGSSAVFVSEMDDTVGEISNVGETVIFALARSISVGVGVNNMDVGVIVVGCKIPVGVNWTIPVGVSDD